MQSRRQRAIMASVHGGRRLETQSRAPYVAGGVAAGATAPLALRVLRHPATKLGQSLLAIKAIRWAGHQPVKLLDWSLGRRALKNEVRLLRKATLDPHTHMFVVGKRTLGTPSAAALHRLQNPTFTERVGNVAHRHPKTAIALATAGVGLAVYRHHKKRSSA